MGLQQPQEPLVIGEGARVAARPPPLLVTRKGQPTLWVTELQTVDRPVLDRAVHGGNVPHIGGGRRRRPTGVLAFGLAFGRRDRISDLPLAQVPELRVDREEIMRGGRTCAREPHDDQWALDPCVGLGCVVGIPLFNAQPRDQPADDDVFDRPHGRLVVADIGSNRHEHAVEAFLPSIRSEI
jgi:hypothetical protein